MRRLRIGILDLVTKSPKVSLYGRIMNANLASIMPQVLSVWVTAIMLPSPSTTTKAVVPRPMRSPLAGPFPGAVGATVGAPLSSRKSALPQPNRSSLSCYDSYKIAMAH